MKSLKKRLDKLIAKSGLKKTTAYMALSTLLLAEVLLEHPDEEDVVWEIWTKTMQDLSK
jgi:hypothetical protein